MSHYFIDDDNLKEDERSYYFFNNIEFKFTSNSSQSHMVTWIPPQTFHPQYVKAVRQPSGLRMRIWAIGIVQENKPDQLTMSDVNKRALEYAERNCIDNGKKEDSTF